ncbi:hypothetical protein Dimus_010099 [Dionaea muscipula]
MSRERSSNPRRIGDWIPFGVVVDAFIPRKKSKGGKRFDFVRYDCSVVTNIAIQKTNGLWIHDKEPEVKIAEFVRKQDRHSAGNRRREGGTAGRELSMDRQDMYPNGRRSFAKVVKRCSNVGEEPLTVKVHSIGNGWLYRSAVATFGGYREKMNIFVENHNNLGSHWFSSISPWSVNLIEDDTIKSTCFDVGKVKICTTHSSGINHQMKQVVGLLDDAKTGSEGRNKEDNLSIPTNNTRGSDGFITDQIPDGLIGGSEDHAVVMASVRRSGRDDDVDTRINDKIDVVGGNYSTSYNNGDFLGSSGLRLYGGTLKHWDDGGTKGFEVVLSLETHNEVVSD